MLQYLLVLLIVATSIANFAFGQTAGVIKTNTVEYKEAQKDTVVFKRIDNIQIVAVEHGLPWWCTVDMGTLPAKHKHAFELVFEPDHEIEFTSIRTSCKCHRFDLTDKQLTAGQKYTARVAFKVTGGSETGAGGLTATLLNGEREVGMIVMNYKIASSLHLDSTGYIQINESVSEFDIPFKFTLPFKPSDFEVSGQFQNSDPLFKIEGQPVGDDGVGKATIRGSIDATSIDNVDMGTVSLKHLPSNRVETSSIILVKNPSVSIVPRSLTFYGSDDPKSNKMIAKGLVRLDERLANEIGEWDNLEVYATGAPEKISVVTRKLNSNLYRIMLHSDLAGIKFGKEKDGVIKLELRFGSQGSYLKTLAIKQKFNIEGQNE